MSSIYRKGKALGYYAGEWQYKTLRQVVLVISGGSTRCLLVFFEVSVIFAGVVIQNDKTVSPTKA